MVYLLWFILLPQIACAVDIPNIGEASKAVYSSYIDIPLEGIITDRKQEISGMTTYQDKLILLPENLNGYYFYIPFEEIENTLNTNDTILPVQKTLTTRHLKERFEDFDGFEAIAIKGNDVYIMVEMGEDTEMLGLLIWGTINPKSMEIDIPKENILPLKPPIQMDNYSFESLTILHDKLIVLFEVNGLKLIDEPFQYVVNLSDMSSNKIPFPNIEYRITDATSVVNNKFWTINYYWTGDKEVLGVKDTIGVERLVEFKLGYNGFERTSSDYIILQNGKTPRNWEGLVRYKNGFLITTDKWPRMILGYIPR